MRRKTCIESKCLFLNNTNKLWVGVYRLQLHYNEYNAIIHFLKLDMYVLQKIAMKIIHPRWYRYSKNQGVAHGLYSVTPCHSEIGFRSLSLERLHTFNSNLVYGYILGLCRPSSNLVMVGWFFDGVIHLDKISVSAL